jgi:hypothetical protein
LVVGDDKETAVWGAHVIDAFGNDAEGVDIQTAVGFIEDAARRLEHSHLEDFSTFLLASRKAFVEGTGGEFAVDLEEVHLFVKTPVIGGGVEGLLFVEPGLDGRTDEVSYAYAGYFQGVLECEEETRVGDFVGFLAQDFLSVEEYGAAFDFVVRVAREDFGEGAFASAVRSHEGMDFAFGDAEAEVLEDGFALDGDVEVMDLEGVHYKEDRGGYCVFSWICP